MVCSIGGGKMAVMARVLAAESYSQSIPAAEAGNQRSICNYIHRELFEGIEANLLDEEDMNVYGLMPMEDSLHLVCCNACKKPVKASQYTAHAELCRLLRFEETILEIDGSARHTKYHRKERKKLLRTHAYQNKIPREHERSDCFEVADIVSKEQVGKATLFAMDAQNVGLKLDYSRVGRFTNHSAGVVPSTKRTKLITAERLAQSDHRETECGVTKVISPEVTRRDFPKGSSAGVGKCSNHVLECCLPTKAIPVPLATKVYYSQRSHYLRSAISRMYHGTYAEEYCSDFVTQEISQGDLMPQQAPCPNNFLSEQIMNGQHGKKLDKQSSSSVPNPDRPQSSEPLIDDEGSSPVNNSSKHLPVKNMTRPNTTLRIKYCSKGYSFAGNSGTSLGTKKQPNGSVPVT